IAPLIANMLLLVLMTYLVPRYVGRENVARQQMEGFSARMSPEQLQTAIARANSPASIYTGYVAAAIGAALVLLVISAILFAFGLMTARAPKFASMFAMASLAFFPY